MFLLAKWLLLLPLIHIAYLYRLQYPNTCCSTLYFPYWLVTVNGYIRTGQRAPPQRFCFVLVVDFIKRVFIEETADVFKFRLIKIRLFFVEYFFVWNFVEFTIEEVIDFC